MAFSIYSCCFEVSAQSHLWTFRELPRVALFPVSGRQLQPEEPDADTEEDHSVTEGPVDEIIRPRPQGSSPVYEHAAEGAGSELPEDTPRRRASSGSGGRRSWWKRESGDSRTFSRMSHPQSMQEATEVTLMTEAEAGASGYSVTGGGDQGIFVKQVLKDSSAAKLFSLREGDQLLSATIFFDNIKYEDALKILQYSEPYKVQFQVKRKRPATEDEEGVARGAQHGPKGSEKQDKDVADGSTETPTQTLEGGGDQERLLAKPREGRCRRPQKERLSWPKFQSITSKHMPGPRRSHSSSGAYGRGDAPDVSPTSTDTEAQLPAEDQEQKAGPDGQRKRRFLNLRFRMGSGKGPTLEGRPSRGVQGGALQAGVVEEAGSWEDRREATEATVQSRGEDRTAEVPAGTPIEPGAPSQGALGEGASVASRRRKQTKDTKDAEDAVSEGKPGVSSAPQGGEGLREVAQGMETGIARSALQGKGDAQGGQPEFQIQIPSLKTPMFKLSKERNQDTEAGTAPLAQGDGLGGTTAEETHPAAEGAPGPQLAAPRKPKVHLPEREEGGAGGPEEGHREREKKDGDKDKGGREERRTVLRFNIPSFGWSPRKDVRAAGEKPILDLDQEIGSTVKVKVLHTEDKEILGEEKEETRDPRGGQPTTAEEQRLEGDLSLGDKEVAARDSKFKMPKFKMPSFGASAPSKDLGTSVDVSVPKVGAEATLPSLGGEVRAPEGAVQVPTADIDLPGGELEVSLPEGEVAVSGLKGKAEGVKIKGQLPKVQMPSLKMPTVDIKAPQVDIKGPKLDLKGTKGEVSAPDMEVSLPSMEVDAQVPDAKVEADLSLGHKEVAARDSKFKMPKFKMPSFGTSAPSKSLEASVDASLPEVQAEVSMPSIQADVKTSDMTIELPSADLDVKTASVSLKLPEGQVPEGELQEPSATCGLKGHLPKVQMPSIKMPKVDLKAPQVDIKGPNVDLKGAKGEVSAPDVEVSLPSVEVDAQVPGAKVEADLSLGDKEVASRDSKFKMPKFKMPSFGVSAPSKDLGTSVDVLVPKVGAEATLPSLGGEVRAPEGAVQVPTADIDLPGGELEVSLPEGVVAVSGLKGKAEGVKIKGQLPKVQMPSLKMPKVDIKAPQVDIKVPQVDIKGPKQDLKGTKREVSTPDVEVSLPKVEVDTQVLGAKVEADLSLGHKEVAARDSKFKMPKFKMPSFGTSAPSKSLEASVDASLPEVQAEVSMPSIQVDVKTSDVTIELPSADLDVKTASVGLKLPEGQVPEGELQEPSATGGLKGHLPKVQMPSIKMPKVDLKAPQVDIKGPNVDLKGAKGEVSAPDMVVSLPSVEVDAQVPDAKVEADLSLGHKEVAARDSKFKMPKFKMPSFGTSAPSKSLEASVDASLPEVQAEISMPSIQVDVKTSDMTIELPSADLDVKTASVGLKLPEGQVPEGELQEPSATGGLKGHLPKVQMPSIKMPKVDLKAPQVDIKGPNVDLKSAKGEVSAPDVEVSLPSVEVDAQVPGAKVEADLSLGDKEVAARDSKFKMPKFKMPSFGVSAPSKDLGTSVDVLVPKVGAEATLPSLGGEVRAPEGAVQVPTADIDLPGGELEVSLPEGVVAVSGLKGKAEGVKIKGQLPKVQMPSLKMPKVDIKAPQVDFKAAQVDIKGLKLDLKGAKGEVSTPDMVVSLPSVEMDAQVPDAKVEVELSLGDKEVASRDSKFKMPKFKMPSFGASAPSKDLGTSVDVLVPKVGAEATLPSLGGEVRAPEGAVQVPTADIDLPGDKEVAARDSKFKMPKFKIPSFSASAPSKDLGTSVDVLVPKVGAEATLPSLGGEVQAPEGAVQVPTADIDLPGDKEVAARDSKFKMPKFKMPSFGTLGSSKSLEASVDASLPKVQAEVSMPSIQADVKTSDVTIELPSADLDVKTASVSLKLPEGQVPEGELQEPSATGGLKGHLPKVQMPSIEMPKVDLKAPQVDIKGPNVDLKGAKGEVSAPDVEVSLPSVEVDAQVPGAKLDSSSGEVEVFSKATKFKFPKISISSSRTSPSKTSLISPELDTHDKDTHISLSSGLRDPIVSGGDQHALHLEGDVALSVGKDGEKSKSKKSHFKLPKVFSPPGKAAKGFVASAEETEVPLPVRASASPLESGHGGPQGTPAASVETSLQVSRLGWLSGPHGESSCLSTSEGVTLTKYQVTVPRGPVPSELPCETPSGSQAHSQLPSTAGAGDLLSSESILLSQPDGHMGPADTVFPESYGRVTFPKFHRPKFRLSLPTSAAGVVEPGAAERAPPTSPPLAAQGLASSAEEATAFPVPDGHLPPAGVPASMVAEGQAGTAGTSAAAPEGAPAEGAGRKGQGRPMTAPRLKLPSFSWSPKKGVESKADPGHSPAVAADALGGPPGGPVTPAEAGADASLGKDGEVGAVRTPALARLKVAPPGMEASTWGAGLPQGDPGLALAGPTDTAGGEGGIGGAGAAAGPPEGADVSLHLPEAPVPSLGFVKPDLSPGGATMEGSLSTGRLPLPKHGLSLRDSTQEHGPGDSSASQLCGDVTASSAEDPLQPSPAVGSPGRDAAVAEAPAGSRESWFRMPSLRLPGFGRAPKERAGSAGLGAQRPAPVAAGVPGEGEAAAEVRSADARAPTSEGDVAKSLQPPEAGADGAAAGSPASSYADVLRRNLDLHAPAEGLSASEVRVRPGAGSLPLQLHAALAEPCVPPGEAGEPPLPGAAAQGLGRGAQGAEGPPSQPEGPLRLRASSTEVPSQVSVVNVGQVWEDSVLRVQFPKLKVPRFSFLAPGSEADVFVPSVTELSSCPQSGPDTALLEQSPGGRGSSFPKAPVALGLSSEAAPVCKVRVHIQGTEAASRQVAVHSMVTAGYAELSGPGAFPTQMVQESEVPASETQTPSYGVSLLKGRVPEPPTWAQVHLVTAECGLGGRLREAREPVPGADPVSGDLQPDTGEPFEMICPSVDVPGPPVCSSDLHSGHGHADSCSDEEPAEILEFPPEEGQEAEAAQAPKGKPEGISSSGLFRFWLPSIGFSSSASETSADAQADAQRPAPVQTQPEARTPPSQEKGGWFRFPKLGFSSSPTKKSESEEEEVSLAEQSLQEEAGTFYDARESFSPEETGAGELAEAAGARQGSGTMVTSTARTELILLERDGAASQQSAPRPATK
uniref:protein AHNAK2 isoform X2 n=1 Tax=Halichoerus grypus TaxID=9711 RepID=UPI001658EEA6|nr:protein AHNAK2 isoform X2 [Halichoerus grypus]